MQAPSLPNNEQKRLAALNALEILDTPAEEIFDDFTFLASNICGTPIAAISLIDETRQWFKSKIGIDADATSREVSFCSHTILQDDILEIADALSDVRFMGNPLVIGQPGIRFYAGMPIQTKEGYQIGTLCVVDKIPRKLTETQRSALRKLTRQLMSQIELRLVLKQNQRLNKTLSETVRFSKNIIDNIPASIGYWDKNLVCKYANTAYAKIYRDQEIDIMGKTLSEAASEELMLQIKPYIDGVLKGFKQQFEMRLTENNQIVRREAHYIPDIDEAGHVRGFYIYALDITALRLAEEENRLAEIAMRKTETGILIFNSHHQIISVNRTFTEMSGYPQSELVGRTPDFLFDTASIQTVLGALNVEKDWRGEGKYRKKNGEYIDHLGAVSILKDEHGVVTHYMCTLTDLSEKIKLEQALTTTQKMLERTGEIANIGGWEYDLITQELRWGEQIYVIHEVENRAPPSLELALSFYTEEARPILETAIDHCINHGQSWDLELPFITAKGNPIWVRAIGELVIENGQKTKLAGVFQDISTQKAQEQATLNKEIELRNTVIREVHHHIKNNIQGISGILYNATHVYPALTEPLNEAIAQLQSVAVIHGLQGKTLGEAIELRELTLAISQNIQSIWQTNILVNESERWINCQLSKNEAVPIALILNELMTNAEKHNASTAPVRVELSQTVKSQHNIEVNIRVINDGDFEFNNHTDDHAEHFGLKLVYALMPKTGAYLYLSSSQNATQAILTLNYPVIKAA